MENNLELFVNGTNDTIGQINLYGDEPISLPDGSTYNGCDTAAGPINMSSTGALPANRKNRLHMPFRNVYQLRSQGLAG